MDNPIFDIEYSVDFEVERVKYTLQKMSWYIAQGYSPKIPENIDATSSDAQVRAAIEQEWVDDDYSSVNDKIPNKSIQGNKLLQFLATLFPRSTPKSYNIFLTKYGVGGSYRLPNSIVLNINNKRVSTIFHEMVHLSIEPLVKKHKLLHWEKERTVDLILHLPECRFLKYDRWQKSYDGVEKYVDTHFAKQFLKSPETYFRKMSSKRV